MKRFLVEYADWSRREYAIIAKNLLLGRLHQGPDVERLTQKLTEMYSPSHVQLINYGHYAIEIALQVFKEQRPGRLEIVGPAYICPSVPKSVARCGLQWRGVDVGEDLNIDVNAMKSALGDNTLAVIAPHMYGCAADIEVIENICRNAGIYLIDDAAQAVGVLHGRRLLGTFGDMGILSFAQSKMVVTGVRGSGGGLLINNHRFLRTIEERCAVLATSSGRLGPVFDFIWNYLAAPYTGNTGYYIWRLAAMIGLRSKNVTAMQMGNLDSAVALVQLARIDSILASKRRVADIYQQVLIGYPTLRFAQYTQGCILARLVIEIPENVDMGVFLQIITQEGIQVRKAYPIVLGVGDALSGFPCSNRFIGMPSGRMLIKKDIEYICATIDRALNVAQLR